MHKPVTYGTYEYPGWAIGVGWIFALCSVVPLPVIAIVEMYREEGPMKQVLYQSGELYKLASQRVGASHKVRGS